jgi:DNA-binding IclR family transcriptional regulator
VTEGTASRPGTSGSQLARGLRALEELASRPQTAAELARALGVNRSTALRLLQELEGTGYVTRDGTSRRFSTVLERIYALVARNDDHSDWIELIHPVLASMRDDFREAAMQAVPANGAMVYLALFPSLHPVAVLERVGTVRPMHCSALGKAYLSALDAKSLDVELGRLAYAGGTPGASKGPLELRRRVAEARELGYAVDREETFEGVICVAAPTRVGGAVVGAAGVSGPANRLPEERVSEIAAALVERLAALDR